MNTRIIVVTCLALVGCTEKNNTPPVAPAKVLKAEPVAPSGERRLVEAGPLTDDVATFEFAVYFLGSVPKDAEATAKQLAKKLAPSVPIETTPQKDQRGPAMNFSTPSMDSYAPPGAKELKYFGRGLSADELRKVPTATGAFVVTGIAPTTQADETHRALLALVHALAAQWNGVIWDEDTREVFSTSAWEAQRLRWKSGAPDIIDHVTLHQYANGELLRTVSLGMRKFGLPDVVVNDIAHSSSRDIGLLVNLTMQTLAENPVLATRGKLPVDLTTLKNDTAREGFTEGLAENAKKQATLDVAWAEPEDGDPKNRLLELVFGNASESAQEGQHRVTAAVFGFHDELYKVRNDDARLEAAHKRALAAFLKLKKTFKKNKTQLQAKAPFTTDSGGTEWMWVDVTEWKGTKVRGILGNEPYEVSKLKRGARVEFEESAVFDYLLTKSDGSTEGGETNDIIEKMQGR